MKKILVWDLPVRVGHWLLVFSFALAWLTSESEAYRLVHALAGGVLLGVILFRLLWGVLGTQHARFASFVRGPGAVLGYVAGMLRGRPAHVTGHNPAGGWAIVGLLCLGLLTGGSGWLIYQDLGGHWVEELHESLAVLMLAVAMVHVGGVILGSLLHRENLIRAMLGGYKLGEPNEAISGARPLTAVLMLGWIALCAWWLAR